MKDHEIIELYWARNESAIAATAEKYGNYCHTIAYNILRNKEDAEECANDTYLRAWSSIPPQRPNRLSITTWENRAKPRPEPLLSGILPKNADTDK